MSMFRLTERARTDMASIGRYTQERWGRAQRNAYLAGLDAAFHLLAREPQRGRDCGEVRPGYRKYHIGRHLVFYRASEGGVEIIRILHDRMDIISRLSDP